MSSPVLCQPELKTPFVTGKKGYVFTPYIQDPCGKKVAAYQPGLGPARDDRLRGNLENNPLC